MQVKDATVIQNKFAGTCRCCSKRVSAYEGIAMSFGAGWTTAHFACEPEYSAPLVKGIEEKKAQYAASVASQKAEAAAATLAYEALLFKLGIDFNTTVDATYTQHAWSDYTEMSYPLFGDGTDEEFKQVFRKPAQSSIGQLRWSNGVSLVSVDRVRKLVRVSESVGICD